ncbi:putative membrane protein (plasmid) [Bacillus pseudomycoides]|nr:putative membrane protein [Bacillus pseudomycoides]AJI14740.1 putative membrane protein [Bacillus pseudomycoides]
MEDTKYPFSQRCKEILIIIVSFWFIMFSIFGESLLQ